MISFPKRARAQAAAAVVGASTAGLLGPDCANVGMLIDTTAAATTSPNRFGINSVDEECFDMMVSIRFSF